MATWLITGGAGFIGSNFVLRTRDQGLARVVNLDKLTYAGNLANLTSLDDDPDHVFVHGDICDSALVRHLLQTHQPEAIVHFAAESHVDRSILNPNQFVRTNVNGTHTMLCEATSYWEQMPARRREAFRFVHVSTDEVFGSLDPDDPPFNESSRYEPNSPYAASKAAADHLVRAYWSTYGLPTITTNCSNNYGPYQFPEKLIPLMILRALEGVPLPVYGDGRNKRDWIYVGDHCEALRLAIAHGRPGQSYSIGGNCEMENLDVVRAICRLLDRIQPGPEPYESLISFVSDRRGHDRRYAIDPSRITNEFGWRPQESFQTGLEKTVRWYLGNQAWVASVRSGEYLKWVRDQYGHDADSEGCGDVTTIGQRDTVCHAERQ